MYPVSQAADITAFKATLVPVGGDQLPMIEQTNELVRKFNHIAGRPVLVECKELLSAVPRLSGVDGKSKMSKSLGNAIALGASADEIKKAVNRMYTDSGHLRVEDPGQVEGNVVFEFLDVFEPDTETLHELKAQYRRGGLGDGVLKKRLLGHLHALLAPIRADRARFAADKGEVLRILKEGTLAARSAAATTVSEVKHSLGLNYFH